MKTRIAASQIGKTKQMMELRVRMLLRNGLVSRSGMTLADTDVLKEITARLGYDPEKLKELDISDPDVNPFAHNEPAPAKSTRTNSRR